MFLLFFSAIFRILTPFQEFSLDAGHILKRVIQTSLEGKQAGGALTRYWFQDNLFQLWLGWLLPVREFADPLTATSLQRAVLVVSLLPKLLGSVNVALIFILCVNLGASRLISCLLSMGYAVTAQHLIMSSIVERQVIAQSFLIASFVLPTISVNLVALRFVAYGASIAVNVFGIVCYSPPIIYLPFLLLFIISYEFQYRRTVRWAIFTVVLISAMTVFADTLVFGLTGSSAYHILHGAISNFMYYADPSSKDPFSRLDNEMLLLNVIWFFSHMLQWSPYLAPSTLYAVSIFPAILSAIMVISCLCVAFASFRLLLRENAQSWMDAFGSPNARICLLSAAFLAGLAFTLAVRHGNQSEFYVLPYTFIIPVMAYIYSKFDLPARLKVHSLSVWLLLLFLGFLDHPLIGENFSQRNQYIVDNWHSIQQFFADE